MLRNTVFSPSWWVSTFLSTIVTMCFIVLIKKLTANIPGVKTITEQVQNLKKKKQIFIE